MPPKQWWKHKTPAPWLGPQSVARIKVQPGKVGGVYHRGMVFFKRPESEITPERPKKFSRIPVVIKTFPKNASWDIVMPENVSEHIKLVDYLRRNRVPIPKSGYYQVKPEDASSLKGIAEPGEWIFFQQLFHSGGQGKIPPDEPIRKKLRKILAVSEGGGGYLSVNTLTRRALFYGKPKAREQAIQMYTKLANIGILPDADIVAPLRTRHQKVVQSRWEAIPFDITHAVPFMHPPEFDLAGRILTLKKQPNQFGLVYGLQSVIIDMTHDRREALRLYQIAKANANPKLRAALEKDEAIFVKRYEFDKKWHVPIK